MWYDWGNVPINSTTPQPVSNPSTSVLCAEIDSTQLGTVNLAPNQAKNVRVTWLIGSDTNVTWQLETCTSTALSAGVDILFVKTPANQSGQYVTNHQLLANYRIRARMQASVAAGNTVATIQAEPVT